MNYKKADSGSDYGINGAFELIRQKEELSENDITGNSIYNSSWTEEEIIKAVNERSQYYKASAYYSEIIDYWENAREVRDITNVLEPLFETDKKYYTKEEFESEPMLVIHLAKNEIYARHGYIFKMKIYIIILWGVSGIAQLVTVQILMTIYLMNMKRRILKYCLIWTHIKIVFEKK